MRRSPEQELWHGCYRKQAFKSASDAHTASRRRFGRKHDKDMHAYQCPVCGLWHMTTKKVVSSNI